MVSPEIACAGKKITDNVEFSSPSTGMDKKARNNVMVCCLKPPICESLKPLSMYSRMTCNRKADLQQSRRFSTFNHLEIEVRNNWINKRKPYYSSPDEGYVSPLKKPLSLQALSPDLECFTDYYSPFVRQQSTLSYPEPLPKKQNVGSAVKQPVNSWLHSEHIKQCGSSTDPGGEEEIVQKHITSENILLKFSPVFDYDVNTICYLNPINTCTAAGNLDPAESCTAPHCNTFPEKQFPAVPAVQHLEEMERRVGRESLGVSDDRGYVSLSSINDHKGDGLLNSKQLTGNSNPHLRVVENGCHPQRSPKPQYNKQTVTSGGFTVAVDDLSPAVSGPFMELMTSVVESLEGETEGVWDIGPPMLESSPYGKVRPNTASDRRLASESSGHSTEDTNLEDAWENTLPLQVQVHFAPVLYSSALYMFSFFFARTHKNIQINQSFVLTQIAMNVWPNFGSYLSHGSTSHCPVP